MRCDWFSQYENVYNTRSTGQRIFNVPFARPNQCTESIITAGLKLWNTLLLEINKYSSYDTLKCKIKLNCVIGLLIRQTKILHQLKDIRAKF